MTNKLTKAQQNLLENLKANPRSEAYDYLGYIHNPLIRKNLVESLRKSGYLIQNKKGEYYLSPNHTQTCQEEPIIKGVEFAAPEESYDNQNDDAEEEEEEPEQSSTNKEQDTDLIHPNGTDLNKKNNKKAMLLEMLKKKSSLQEMIEATGWKEISVRGVLSQLKKEKNLTIIRTKGENKQNIYSIAESIQ